MPPFGKPLWMACVSAVATMTPYGNIRLVIFAQLRAKPVFDLVKGIVDLMATRLGEASQLKVGTSGVFTPFAEGCFATEHGWSRQ